MPVYMPDIGKYFQIAAHVLHSSLKGCWLSVTAITCAIRVIGGTAGLLQACMYTHIYMSSRKPVIC